MDFHKFDDANQSNKYVDFDQDYLECETMLAQANTLIGEQRIQEAVELLFKILQFNPHFGKAHNYLGWIYEIHYQNCTSAEKYYKNAMKYEPNYPASYTHYARLLSTCKRFDELKAHLDMALTIPTVSNETIYSEYALMYEMQQNPEVAINYYLKAAMTSLKTESITLYEEAINRCKKKLELKNLLDS